METMPQPRFVTVPRGEAIFYQGQEVVAVFHLVQGRVSLWQDRRARGHLGSGHLLGLDGAYAPDGTYSFTAWAEADCRLAEFHLHLIPEALLDSSRLAEATLFSLSRQVRQGWERLRQDQAEDSRSFVGQVISLEAGQVLLREGEHSQDMYRIVSTEQGLEVSVQGRVLSVLDTPGDFFGEMAAVLQEPRTATIRSLGSSVLEVYPAALVPQILEDYPELSRRLIHGLSQRLHQANAQVKA
mgnify:CR=1 FL=1